MPHCKPISVGRPGAARYTTPSPHPITDKRSAAIHAGLICVSLLLLLLLLFLLLILNS